MAGVIPNGVEWLGSAELHPYLVVDVFTSQPLEGNQLGVFLDGRPFDAEQMQRLARELKFAETVFLLAPSDGRRRVDPHLHPTHRAAVCRASGARDRIRRRGRRSAPSR